MRFYFFAPVHYFHLHVLEPFARFPQLVGEHALAPPLEEFVLQIGQFVREAVVHHRLIAVQHEHHQLLDTTQKDSTQLLPDELTLVYG